MAMVISVLSPIPEPVQQQGEKQCAIHLSFTERHGYRLKASTLPGNREIGRWVSDCPLSIVESALLWLSRFAWEIVEAQDSLSTEAVLDGVERPSPNHPDVHPLDVITVLSGNFPPKEPTSPVTGARVRTRRQIPGRPPVLPPAPAGMLPGPVDPGATDPRRQIPGAQPLPPPAQPAPVDPRILHWMSQILDNMQGALAQGTHPIDVLAQIDAARTQNPQILGSSPAHLGNQAQAPRGPIDPRIQQGLAGFLHQMKAALGQGAPPIEVMEQIDIMRSQNPEVFGPVGPHTVAPTDYLPDDDDGFDDDELDAELALLEQQYGVAPGGGFGPAGPAPAGYTVYPPEVPLPPDLAPYDNVSETDRQKLLHGSQRQREALARARAADPRLHTQLQPPHLAHGGAPAGMAPQGVPQRVPPQGHPVQPPLAPVARTEPDNGIGEEGDPAELHRQNLEIARQRIEERKRMLAVQEANLEAEIARMDGQPAPQRVASAPSQPVPAPKQPAPAPQQPAPAPEQPESEPQAAAGSASTPTKTDFVTYLVQFESYNGQESKLKRKTWDELNDLAASVQRETGVPMQPGA